MQHGGVRGDDFPVDIYPEIYGANLMEASYFLAVPNA